MAMTAGTVSIGAGGSETKSGLAGEIYDAIVAQTIAISGPEAISGTPDELKRRREGLAAIANGVASAIVTHITTNARAVVNTSDSGLQRTPNPNNADTNTAGPSAKKTLTIE